ncbi:oxalate/formate antiporter protein (macronuclear) [Tetrahymena thermophila SB210]|uniref:Oxalate/formate antiporter protein n=1 Tax=Tetrahymena thermophila (strain SB210) TaxID=312017 RepID=W7X922_TETTS|nr:oxalate/formate antiporter protein [Tetrahymena thermophila SB210]EWS72888.1 oxalate/formate antiporter protein [Tetrahymena thermophila SB210]|eukprot:XP_012654577.1 oxalate/formate antiporter protein [Tetrahymena thermophila SB210]
MIQQIKYYNRLEEFKSSSLLYHQVLHIDLYNNQIGDEFASVLGSDLAKCINLSNLTLELESNQIGAMGASGLGSALANCINLSNLTLDLEQKQFICFGL